MSVQILDAPPAAVQKAADPTATTSKPKAKRRRTTMVKLPARIIMRPVQIPEIKLPVFDLPYDDDEPLESNWHRAEMRLLIEAYQHYRAPERNFYASGNMLRGGWALAGNLARRVSRSNSHLAAFLRQKWRTRANQSGSRAPTCIGGAPTR
jgi:hypothetical protein